MKTLRSRCVGTGMLFAGLAVVSSAHAVWVLDVGTPTNIAAVTTDGSGNATATTVPGDGTVSATGVYAANNSTTGFATSPSGAKWVAGALVDWSGGGLGMNSDGSAVPNHAIDNNGTNTEAVILQFSKSIVLSGIGLGYATDTNQTGTSVDVSLFRWTGSGTPTGTPTPLVGQGAAAMSGWELVGNYGDMVVDKTFQYNQVNTGNANGSGTGGAGGKGSSWWLISAYSSGYTGAVETRSTLDQGNDYFKLFAVAGSVCTSTVAGVCGPANSPNVPEPGSLALVTLALGGAWSVRRRRLGTGGVALTAA